MDKKILLVIPLAIVVLTSGCTALENLFNPQTSADPFVTIDVDAFPKEVVAGEDVDVVATIENTGAAGGPIIVNFFDFSAGLFRPTDIDSLRFTIDSLGAFEKREVIWNMVQTPAAKVNNIKANFKILVTYPGTSTSLTTVGLINEDEKTRQIQEGTWKIEKPVINKGQGPVIGWIEILGTTPISVDRGEIGNMNIKIMIEDVGGVERGSVFQNNVFITDFKLAQIDGIDNVMIDLDCFPEEGTIELIDGKFSKVCSATISEELTDFEKEITIPFFIEVSYIYSVHDEVEVVIKTI